MFFFTKKVAEGRKVAAEMIVSMTECRTPISLEDYVEIEDRRVVNSPGFSKLGQQEKMSLGGQPAFKNRYTLTPPGEPGQTQKKVIHQYYALDDDVIWGITLSSRREDEAVLKEIESTAMSSFEFSVPPAQRGKAGEGALAEPSLEVFRKVTIAGSQGGFSLNVPESWEVKQTEEQGCSIKGPEVVVYAFSVPAEKTGGSPRDAAGEFLKERENLDNLQVLSQGLQEIAGRQGYAVEYSGVGEGRRWRVWLVAFADAERVFFIHCLVPEAGWERNKDVVKRIAESFSATPPSAEVESRS